MPRRIPFGASERFVLGIAEYYLILREIGKLDERRTVSADAHEEVGIKLGGFFRCFQLFKLCGSDLRHLSAVFKERRQKRSNLLSRLTSLKKRSHDLNIAGRSSRAELKRKLGNRGEV